MIRLMEERDIPQVAELERLCFSTPWSENSLKESLVRPEYLFLVEETDGKVTAYGGLLQVMEEGDVTNIAVHPQHRLKGSGTRVTEALLEEGRKLYEVMDLGFGACRMCVCGPESAREVLNNNQLIRVATKYPNIAKDYFYNKKHQTVEIIKLNGSIELAPIVGLSEVIVDIVETGSTLRENGLKVLEEVCPLSARMVVNQVSMKMEDERIRKLITELRSVIK